MNNFNYPDFPVFQKEEIIKKGSFFPFFTFTCSFYIIGVESGNEMIKNNFYDLRLLILKYDLENYIKNFTTFEVSFLNEEEHKLLEKYLDDDESIELIREAVLNIDDVKELDHLIEEVKKELSSLISPSDSELEQTINQALSFLPENVDSGNQRVHNLFYHSQIFVK